MFGCSSGLALRSMWVDEREKLAAHLRGLRLAEERVDGGGKVNDVRTIEG